MENLDVVVLRTLHTWRAQGLHAVLATVVRTWGSSPRPVGSIMALCETGAVVGSVSGGCIEDDLIHQYARSTTASSWAGQPPARVKYGVTADEAHRFGLPCGGTLELVLEFDPDVASLAHLLSTLETGQLMQRRTDLHTGQVQLTPTATPSEVQLDTQALTNVFGPEYRMLIIGAGQLSEYLSTMALFSGFAVTVCDPRQEYTGAWPVAQARLVSDMPDDVVRDFKPDHRTCIVAVTHDPKLDDLALLEALQTDAFYIGAIGSRRNNAARHQRMIEHFDQTPESLARLRGPIGLYIGSKTPPEIAVSIMAEILSVKNGVALPETMQVGPAKAQRALDASATDGPVCG
jgi:xanthine dehydrogenase accessory factor